MFDIKTYLRRRNVISMEQVMLQLFDDDLLEMWRFNGIEFGEIVSKNPEDVPSYLIEDLKYESLCAVFTLIVDLAVCKRGTQFIEPNFD